jgi:ABC-type amino acid transport substrate-binding protein
MRRVAAVLLVAGIVLTAGVARAADPPATAPVTSPPGAFVVALGLQSPLLQAGVVRGRDVILARGFEVELARTLARRLGGRVGRFVYVPSQARLLASSAGGWQLALGGIDPARGKPAGADLSLPYLTTDVAVVTRRGLLRPRRLADLRPSALCAVRGSDGARAAVALGPRQRPVLVDGDERLRTLIRTGACDAALVPAVEAGRFVAGQRGSLGPVVGRIRSGEGLVVAVPRGGGVDIAAVDRELARLRRDGTLGRLAWTWLGLDPASLPVLR